MDAEATVSDRLEKLLMLRWVHEGRSPECIVNLSLRTTAAELGLDGEACLAVVCALDALENGQRVSVIWPGRPFDSDDVAVLLSRVVTHRDGAQD